MNNQQKITACEARIRELVPELQELTLGCRVWTKGMYGDNNIICGELFGAKKMYSWLKDVAEMRSLYIDHDAGSFVILGHPIQLHHVLQAMYACEVVGAVDAYGHFMLHMKIEDENDNYGWTDIVKDEERRKWNLSKSFTDQEEETKLFVGELIGIK